MNDIFERSKGLLGEERYNKLKDKTIAVIGLGGVGGTALESLARTGIENFIIIDFDVVDSSNLNRQILYTYQDIGKEKVVVAKQRIESINPNVKISAISAKIGAELPNLLNKYRVDFIVDAIDDVNGKVQIVKYAINNKIPFIISLGMANRLDPSKVFITRLDKTTNDPLARKFRYELKKEGIDTKEVKCVVSSEQPFKEGNKLFSLMQVPSSSGLNISYYVLEYFK